MATLLFQSPVLQGEFLFYDDARFVVRNESIETLSNTGRPHTSWPALPGVTPATTCVPYSILFSVSNDPSRPVMP